MNEIVKFRDNSVILFSDTHSYEVTFDVIKNTRNIDECDLVFCGDGSEGFGKVERDIYWLNQINNQCAKRNIRLFCIRGNHSSPDIYNKNYEFSNLFLVKDYTEGLLPNGKTCLFVGGAISLDRYYRKRGRDWWPDEITEYKKVNKKIDILFSHDCPSYFNHSTESLWNSPYQKFLLDDADLYQDSLNQRSVIDQIVKDISCVFIASGHFHLPLTEEKNEIRYRCIGMGEVWELNSENLS